MNHAPTGAAMSVMKNHQDDLRGERAGRDESRPDEIIYTFIFCKFSNERRALSSEGMVGRSFSTTNHWVPLARAIWMTCSRLSVPSPTSAKVRSGVMSLT